MYSSRALSARLYVFAAAAAISLGATSSFAQCTGPGAPTDTQTRCLTAVQIPGNPLRSFDISWVNPDRAEYYLGDRSNAGIDIIDTEHNTFKRRLGGFVGAVLNAAGTAVNNAKSGPNGVVSHGHWLYGGDGNSTLKIFDLNLPTPIALVQNISTGGTLRVDEMALTTDGKLLLAANNADDPPFGTLFRANGDQPMSTVVILSKITVSNTIIPAGFGLSIEQPAWDPKTARFLVSIPVIANNPAGCNFGQVVPAAPITCDGGVLVVDPATATAATVVYGAFNPTTNTGVVPLHRCGPNGATVGPHDTLLLGCTPQNNPSDTETLVIDAITKNTALIENITGSDEVWFNRGDFRYYLGASRACGTAGTCPDATHPGLAALGVVSATSILIEKIPQSSGSHSVAADSKRNFIYVPQVAPATVVGAGGDITTVGQGICGSSNGCIAVYFHKVDHDDDDDHGHDHDH